MDLHCIQQFLHGISRMRRNEFIPIPHDLDGPGLSAIRSSTDDESGLSELAAQLMSALSASGVAVAIQSPGDLTTMVCVARCGDAAPPLGAILDINSGISGRAVRENRPLHSDDTATDPRVDKEACERLGVRSVAAVPISRDSRCIGILEVFSNQSGAFDAAALSRIEAEALRASVLIDGLPVEMKLPDPQNWEEESPAFKLDHAGRLSALQVQSGEVASDRGGVRPKILSLLEFSNISTAIKPRWRWIALASVATSLAFSAPRLLHRVNATSTDRGTESITEETSNAHVPAGDFASTAALVSDAAPSVRVLMAKAVGGNNTAQAALANHYAMGDGVTRDPVKAAVWAVIASANGSRKADKSAVRIASSLQPYEVGQVQFNLGTMFRDGIGTRRNLLNAYSWFSLSEKTGDVRASAALLNLQQVMSPSEIAEAQRRAPELLNHFKK